MRLLVAYRYRCRDGKRGSIAHAVKEPDFLDGSLLDSLCGVSVRVPSASLPPGEPVLFAAATAACGRCAALAKRLPPW